MSKFIKIIINRRKKNYKNIGYLPKVINLYKKYAKYLNDDYFAMESDSLVDVVIDLIEKCGSCFWIIVDKKTDKFAGFVFLDNWIGKGNKYHSAEVTTCFEPAFWGKYTKDCAKKFIKYCFKKYKIKKLKACIFPQNFRVRGFLKKIGFKKEALLRSETFKNGEMQDVEVYSIIKKEN